MIPEILFTPAALATVFLAFLCAILCYFRDMRNRKDDADLTFAAFQYFAGIAAFISLMIFLWSL